MVLIRKFLQLIFFYYRKIFGTQKQDSKGRKSSQDVILIDQEEDYVDRIHGCEEFSARGKNTGL